MGTSPSPRLGREGAASTAPSRPAASVGERPKIVCLCGSTRFLEAFDDASIRETLAGHIVLGIASTRRSDRELFEGLMPPQTESLLSRLAQLHAAKIDLADEIFVVNVDGYIGSSTCVEIDYATRQGKPVRYLVPPEGRAVRERSR